MTSYNAPVEEMLFLFENLKDNKNYNEIDKLKDINSELVKDILDQAAKILGDMAATYFVSVAAIVAAFYAGQAFTKKPGGDSR